MTALTTYDYLPVHDTLNTTFKDDAATLRWALRSLPKDRLGDFLADWDDHEDLIEWMGLIKNWVAYAVDPQKLPAHVFPNFEPRARWVLDQVDRGLIDHVELYDFIKDWTFCKGMEPWYAEVVIREENVRAGEAGGKDAA
jgi:hypothetical protein